MRDKLAPDISIYPINDQPQGDAKTDLSKMDLFVEFKIGDTCDPFRDPENLLHPKAGDFLFENDSDDAQLPWPTGLLCCCSLRVSVSCSHFLCCVRNVCDVYSFGSLWCDRDSALRLYQTSHFLAGFFWHFDHLDRRRQGYNTSVSSATPEDIQLSKAVCVTTTRLTVNSVYSWFRAVMSLKSKSDLSYHFLQNTHLLHRLDEPLDQC